MLWCDVRGSKGSGPNSRIWSRYISANSRCPVQTTTRPTRSTWKSDPTSFGDGVLEDGCHHVNDVTVGVVHVVEQHHVPPFRRVRTCSRLFLRVLKHRRDWLHYFSRQVRPPLHCIEITRPQHHNTRPIFPGVKSISGTDRPDQAQLDGGDGAELPSGGAPC